MKTFKNGFTLIELLISMTLLAMLMMLGTWSFSIFTSNWEGRLGYFSRHVSQSKDFILLSDIMSSISPYLYKQSENVYYYFEANEQSIKGVNQNSIFLTDAPVFFKLSIETFHDGKKYLLYQEGKLEPFNSSNLPVYTHEKILIKDAHNIGFSILAWNNAREKIETEDPLSGGSSKHPVWHSSYNSSNSHLMPIAIKIIWNQSALEFPIINEQGKWYNLVNQFGAHNG